MILVYFPKPEIIDKARQQETTDADNARTLSWKHGPQVVKMNACSCESWVHELSNCWPEALVEHHKTWLQTAHLEQSNKGLGLRV